jgi:poly(3-hydroxybutyrate) depolymerase
MFLTAKSVAFYGPMKVPKESITKEIITSAGKKRAYYLFVPENIKSPAPLLITLHGSGRNGLSLVEKWKNLAAKEGFIVVGPDSLNTQAWVTPGDGPDFLRDLVDELKAKYPINPRRVYMFGHSGGAVFALGISMFESKYFAASAIHAGAWRDPREFSLLDYLKRKIPISIVVGDQDPLFPSEDVKKTGEKLKERGVEVEVTVIKGHNHWYYSKSSEINARLWDFLKRFELSEDPQFEQYQFAKD